MTTERATFAIEATADAGAGPGADPAPPKIDALQATRRYRPGLVRYFRRQIGCPHEAEDLAQETLMRLLRSSARVANIEAYLLRIASNLLRDRFRRDRSRAGPLHEPYDESVHDLPAEAPSGACVYEDRQRLQRFLAALEQLPPRCRQVFLLQRYEGLTYAAIARRLGISASGVEKHMMRAILHFQTHLTEP